MNIQATALANNLALWTGGSQKSAAAAGSSSSASSANYDVRDLNQDGYVSPQEELLYSLQHPAASSSRNFLTQYTSEGKVTTSGNRTSQFLNFYA